MRPDEAVPARLEAALKKQGRNVTVINHGVSGDTSAGGLSRLDWSLADRPDVVILELGSNDMLRGTDPSVTEKALDAIIVRLKGRGIPVLLAGMRAAPNLGPDYGRRFDAIYPRLAARHDVLPHHGERRLCLRARQPAQQPVVELIRLAAPLLEAHYGWRIAALSSAVACVVAFQFAVTRGSRPAACQSAAIFSAACHCRCEIQPFRT